MMKTLRPLLLTVFFLQFASAQTTFNKPSEAYESARRPLTEWKSAVESRRIPATPTPPQEEVRQRFKQLCPLFSIKDESGEELYWLAKLCEGDHEKALTAIALYLSGSELTHAADARWLLATQQMQKTGSWESSWPTIKLIAQQDPVQEWFWHYRVAIDDESDDNPKTSLEWSKELYAILLARSKSDVPQLAPISLFYALIAGSDLVYRYHLSGDEPNAAKVLAEMNGLAQTLPDKVWPPPELRWANLEMQPAPAIPVTKILGKNSSASLVQPGRVEVISFFFLACVPCRAELPALDDLQKRYETQKLLVADVTTMKANDSSSPPDLEHSLEALRAKSAPDISMVITSDETLSIYGIAQFPVVAIVDKRGRVRYIGQTFDFEDDDSAGKLVHQLIEE
ncbi:MAG: TlpA disulfide reductase family protein [Candidatus Acidiferrales bacterium]